MRLTKNHQLEAVSSGEFEDVTAMIRPLPENVVPSERFLEQMRRRLLALEDATKDSRHKAA